MDQVCCCRQRADPLAHLGQQRQNGCTCMAAYHGHIHVLDVQLLVLRNKGVGTDLCNTRHAATIIVAAHLYGRAHHSTQQLLPLAQ